VIIKIKALFIENEVSIEHQSARPLKKIINYQNSCCSIEENL
jgi:hypothetical protein